MAETEVCMWCRRLDFGKREYFKHYHTKTRFQLMSRRLKYQFYTILIESFKSWIIFNGRCKMRTEHAHCDQRQIRLDSLTLVLSIILSNKVYLNDHETSERFLMDKRNKSSFLNGYQSTFCIWPPSTGQLLHYILHSPQGHVKLLHDEIY